MTWQARGPRVLAIIDWELGTLGHPLADLAYNCLPWHVPDGSRGDLGKVAPGSGIPGEADYVAAYCRRTGRSGIAAWDFYLVLSLFRLAAIAQRAYKPDLDADANPPGALELRAQPRQLAA